MAVSICAVGDIIVDRENPDSIFELVGRLVKQADIKFCQLETNYSERGSELAQTRGHCCRSHPRNAVALKNAGFNVVSCAGNHSMDFGPDALLDTLDLLRNLGMAVVGAGKNIEEARKPVLIEREGTRIAFLAYCSILPLGSWAEANRPGCAPIRVLNAYEPLEHHQPGTPVKVETFPNREDLAAMVSDIRKAKELADIVIVSQHWGLHFVPATLASYQIDVGHAAIDAGADLILGHHPHILKGIEIYKGKVIFYSLCNFALEIPSSVNKKIFQETTGGRTLNPDWKLEEAGEAYPFPADSRKTISVRAIISEKKLQKVSFIPIYINSKAQPEPLTEKDKRFNEVVEYIRKISASQGLTTKFQIDAGEVIPI